MSASSRWLGIIASGATRAGRVLPGDAGRVAEIVGAVVGLAADLVEVGVDPMDHVERVRSAEPELAAMRKRWAEKAAAATRTPPR